MAKEVGLEVVVDPSASPLHNYIVDETYLAWDYELPEPPAKG